MSNSTNPYSSIEHIVVLMMENRSFDNVLGWLYAPTNSSPYQEPPGGQTFNGIYGNNLYNPVPPDNKEVAIGQTTDNTNPTPDPGEDYIQVYGQLYNVNPPPAITDIPPNPSTQANMLGFASNYGLQSGASASDILNCFTPAFLPVISALANSYAVCDQWFASIPTETFCNRSYLHAGTSSGNVFNDWKTGSWPWDIGIFSNNTPTIFNLLENAGVSWRIYYGSYALLCNAFMTQGQLAPFYGGASNRFFQFKQFLSDASSSGTLPSYCFIEPNFMDSETYGPENDMHPPSDVLEGEVLISMVYTALFGSNSSYSDNTMLVIIFDEHGGNYDHIVPPTTISPDGVVIPATEPGGSSFGFNRLGVRIPAVIVAPNISQAGLISHTVYDHTSVISTVINCFGTTENGLSGQTLGKRQAAAADLSGLLSESSTLGQPPMITARMPAPKDLTTPKPLSRVQQTMMVGAARKAAELGGAPVDLSQIRTVHDAEGFLAEREKEFLSSR
jgi:phospholipase C